MPKYFALCETSNNNSPVRWLSVFTLTHLSGLEREMMTVPNFTKMSRSETVLIEGNIRCEDCTCREIIPYFNVCAGDLYYNNCPYLLERLLSGQVYRPHVLEAVKKYKIITPKTIFFTTTHKRLFHRLLANIPHRKSNREEMAALYLIASSEELCKRFRGNTLEQALRRVNTRGLDIDSYTTLCIAKDTLLKTSYTSKEDYENHEIIPDQIMALVYCTLLILRFGVGKSSPISRFLYK